MRKRIGLQRQVYVPTIKLNAGKVLVSLQVDRTEGYSIFIHETNQKDGKSATDGL